MLLIDHKKIILDSLQILFKNYLNQLEINIESDYSKNTIQFILLM